MSTHANPNRNSPSKKDNIARQNTENSRFETRIETLEGKTQDFYNYQLWSPQMLNRIVLIAGVLAVAFCIWASFAFFKKPAPVEPIYTKIEGIKRLGELHLVEHYYESIIPITKQKKGKKDNPESEKLEFLLKAPVKVSGYLDFSLIQLRVLADSLLHINLPPAQISEAYLDLKKTEEYLIEGKLRIFNRYFENVNHEEVYKDIARGINDNKVDVRKRAKINEIEQETLTKAKIFLRNFVSTLGYRIEFSNASIPVASDTINTNTEINNLTNTLKRIAQEMSKEEQTN